MIVISALHNVYPVAKLHHSLLDGGESLRGYPVLSVLLVHPCLFVYVILHILNDLLGFQMTERPQTYRMALELYVFTCK